jgi:hypothetical protein
MARSLEWQSSSGETLRNNRLSDRRSHQLPGRFREHAKLSSHILTGEHMSRYGRVVVGLVPDSDGVVYSA